MELDGRPPSAETGSAQRLAPDEAGEIVVSLRGISKRFANTQALRSIDLEVRSAEVHVLLGENGAGKSTLAKVVAGIVVPDAGRVELGGRAVAFRTPREARQAGVEIVHQETTVVPKMTVEENVTLGNERQFTRFGVLQRTNLRRATRDLLEQVAPHLDPGATVEGLTGSEKHLVAVAKALLTKPRLLILDEPTAALDERERLALFAVVGRARDGGTAILYVTHHLDEVPKVGDRVTVMRDGAVVAECDPSAPESELVAHIAGREVSLTRPAETTAIRREDVLLGVHGVRVGRALRDVSFTAHAGEILGIYGVGQCGTHELAEVLSGHRRPDSGRVSISGQDVIRPTVDRMLDRGLAYLPAERGRKGIVPMLGVGDNITLSNLRRLTRLGLVDGKRSSRYAEELSDRVHVRGGSMRSPITALSGGNQQKALLARALGCETPVLLLHDPTVGVDVGSREEIYASLRDVVRAGRAVVVITSDLLELLSLADRAVVMYRGRLAGEFSGASLDEQQVLQAALGAGAPAQAAASH